jgi:hypothetical protein
MRILKVSRLDTREGIVSRAMADSLKKELSYPEKRKEK